VRGKGEREFLCETARARARERECEGDERERIKNTQKLIYMLNSTVASCNFLNNNTSPDGRMFGVNFSYSDNYFC
jgi:hypothetical protein